MMRQRYRLIAATAFILLIALYAPGLVLADGADPAAIAAPTTVKILAGRSTILDIGSPITRVSLTSADIADALVTSSTQLLVHRKMPGTISMFVWGRSGAVQRYEVSVSRDVEKLAEQIKQLFPNQAIKVESNGRNIVLAGNV